MALKTQSSKITALEHDVGIFVLFLRMDFCSVQNNPTRLAHFVVEPWVPEHCFTDHMSLSIFHRSCIAVFAD